MTTADVLKMLTVNCQERRLCALCGMLTPHSVGYDGNHMHVCNACARLEASVIEVERFVARVEASKTNV